MNAYMLSSKSVEDGDHVYGATRHSDGGGRRDGQGLRPSRAYASIAPPSRQPVTPLCTLLHRVQDFDYDRVEPHRDDVYSDVKRESHVETPYDKCGSSALVLNDNGAARTYPASVEWRGNGKVRRHIQGKAICSMHRRAGSGPHLPQSDLWAANFFYNMKSVS